MVTEADILADIIQPNQATLSKDSARDILRMSFSENAHDRMAELCDGHNRGELEPQELAELESYRRVGLLVDLLQAKARLSLDDANRTPG